MTRCRQATPLLEIERVLPVLSRIALFGGLNEKQLYEVFHRLEHVQYREGEFIFHQGDEPSYIYIILSGRVRIVADADGTPLELIDLGAGQCIGETAVIGVQRHSAGAIAMEDTELIALSRETLLALFDTDKELFGLLMLNLAREAARRLHSTEETLLHYFSGRKGTS